MSLFARLCELGLSCFCENLSCAGLPPSPPPQIGPRPMGVDVNSSKDPKISKAIIIVIASASAMIALFFLGVIWILLVRRSTQTKSPPSIVGPLHAYSTTKRSGLQHF